MNLRNLKLNTVFYLSFGLILLFVALIGVVAQLELSRMGQYSHFLYDHVYRVNQSLREIQRNVNSIEDAAANLSTGSNTDSLKYRELLNRKAQFEQETEKLFQYLYGNYVGPRADVDSANMAYNQWKPDYGIKSITGSSTRPLHYRALMKWTNKMINTNFVTIETFFNKANHERYLMKLRLSALIIFIFISSVIIVMSFIRLIKRPLTKLTGITQQFSRGNYKVRNNYRSSNELGILSDTFNEMASSVEQQYRQLREQSLILEEQKKELLEKYNELETEKEKAQSADRLKTAFLLNISHELRTPLNSIIGFSGILLQQLAGPITEEQEKQLRIVQSSGKHLLSLINDILDISKIEAGEMKPDMEKFDVSEAVDQVINQLTPLATGKGLKLQAEKCGDKFIIESDKKRLTQVLLNLVNNAVKFTMEGSVKIYCYWNVEWVVIEVSDTGIGINEKEIGNLFTPFLRLENNLVRNYEGSGLGLSISKKLVELLHGSISARSQPGAGSTFTVTVPERVTPG